jgi:hypothetical protein
MNDPAMQLPRASDIALDYVRQGWTVVPVPFREKGPRLKGWQNLRIGAEQVARYFRGPTNIGVILGAASGGLVDIDIDCAEAVEIGGRMLPKTGAVFGRAGKPGSHRLYRVGGPAPSMRLDDPVRGDTLIELRGDKQDGTTGFQTVFPGSIHPSGEPIEWEDNGEPAVIEYNALKHHVVSLAMRALIARHCPSATTADEAHHALAQADPRIMEQIARWHGDVDTARPRNDAAQTGHEPLQITEREIARVWTALTFVSSSDRAIWLKVGGVLFDIPGWPEELRRALWDKWSYDMDEVTSERDKKFNEADQATTWASFARDYPGARATLGTIYHLAREAGWNGHTLKPLPVELLRFLPDAATPGVQPPPQTDDIDEAEIKRLAGLPPVQYERQRKEAADNLGMRVPILDKLVKAERGYLEDGEDRQGHALKLPEPKPWDEEVDGFKLMRSLAEAVLRYVVMRDVEDAVIVALDYPHLCL